MIAGRSERLLAPGQERFAGALAHETGLDPRVAAAWTLAEESGGAARGYEGRGYNNWLNIAQTDSGPAGGANSAAWRNPLQAARATSEWLRGQGRIASEYGKPAPGIEAILRAGHDPMAQINAIAKSGWASSGYEGGNALRSLYGELAGYNLPSQTLGPGGALEPSRTTSTQVSSRTEPGTPGTNAAQLADLLQIAQGAGGESVPSLPPRFQNVDSLSVRTPQTTEGPSTASLINLISKIGEDASEPGGTRTIERDTNTTNTVGGEGGGAGHEVNPLPGFAKGRTDMGVDYSAKPGSPIRAIGNAKILGISPDWYEGQPYLYYEVLNEHGKPEPTSSFPDAGKVVYVAEQIEPHVKPGQVVKAGATIATYAGHGTGIETGLGTHSWETLAQQQGNTGGPTHENSPAGVQALRMLERLGAR